MQAMTSVKLARTRAAFESWRASQSGRRRIPEHLWQMTLALLPQYSVSRLCRELGLSYQQLRRRLTNSATHTEPDPPQTPHFLQLRLADLSTGARARSSAGGESRHQAAAANLQMIYERPDGSRLTLSLPASNWDHILVLCQSFVQDSGR